MSYLVNLHKKVTDPFLTGDSAAQMGLMMTLTKGGMFPWRSGGVALLRRVLYPDVSPWQYCGLAIGDTAQIKNYPGMAHSVDQAYQYSAVSFLGNGMISLMSPPVRLDFDGAGNLITPALPNFPIAVLAVALAGGKFRVSWEYATYGQGTAPKDFQVFEGTDPGSVDYNTPLTDSITGLTSVKHVGRRRVYSFTTPAYSNLTSHVFAVRARNATPVVEKNTYTSVSKRARVAVPAAAAAAERVTVLPYSPRGGG